MWLLDANMDVHLAGVFDELGIACKAAANLGWKTLSNGELVTAAVTAGFGCLLTRDQLFAESASHAVSLFPQFAVIVVNLPQQPWREYRQRFLTAWAESPIRPVPGRRTDWP